MGSDGPLFTRTAFERLLQLPENEDRRFELIHREIVETPSRLDRGLIVSTIAGEIYVYLKRYSIGKVVAKVDHFVPEDAFNTWRPDVSFVSNERMQALERTAMCRSCPTSRSRSNLRAIIKPGREGSRLNAESYLAHGSRLVWLVDPETKTIEVYRPNAGYGRHARRL